MCLLIRRKQLVTWLSFAKSNTALTILNGSLLVRYDVIAEDLLEESLLHAGVEETLGGVEAVNVGVPVVLQLKGMTNDQCPTHGDHAV